MEAGIANPSQKSDEGRTDEQVANVLGIGSRDTYRKEKVIVDNKALLDPTDFTEWDEGKFLDDCDEKYTHFFTFRECEVI